MRGSARGRFAATPLLLLGAVAALLLLLQAPTARAACQQCVIEFCGDFPLNMENSDNGDETCGLSKQTALLPQISLSEECTAYIKERFCKLFELQDKWSTNHQCNGLPGFLCPNECDNLAACLSAPALLDCANRASPDGLCTDLPAAPNGVPGGSIDDGLPPMNETRFTDAYDIAVMLSLSEDVTYGAYGAVFNRIAKIIYQMAVDDINRNTSWFDHTKLRLDVRDTRGHHTETISALGRVFKDQITHTFIEERPDALVVPSTNGTRNYIAAMGFIGADMSEVSAPFMASLGGAIVSSGSETIDLNSVENFYHTYPGDVFYAKALVAFFKKFGWKRCGIFYGIDSAPLADSLSKLGRKIGIEVIPYTWSTDFASEDIEKNFQSAKDNNVRIFVLTSVIGGISSRFMFEVAERLGMLNNEYSFVGVQQAAYLTGFTNANRQRWLRGFTSIFPQTPTTEKWKLFRRRAIKAAFSSPDLAFNDTTTNQTSSADVVEVIYMPLGFTYDAVFVIAHALKKVISSGRNVTLQAINEEVAGTDFIGITNHVAFDEYGDRILVYDFMNYDPVANAMVVKGNWDPQTDVVVLDEANPIIWADGTSITPSDAPIRHVKALYSRVQTSIIVVAAVAFCLSVALHVLLVKYRMWPVIKASNPVFCHLIVGGSLLAYGVIVMDGIDVSTSPHMCWLMPICLCISFDMILGSSTVKTYQLHVIFNQKHLKVRKVSKVALFSFVGGLVLYEIICAVVWTTVARPEAVLKAYPLSPFTDVWVCSSQNSLVWFLVLGVPKGILLTASSYLAYKVRHVDDQFNETHHIFVGVYNILTASVVAVIVTQLLGTQIDAVHVVRSMGILLGTVGCVLVLFIPKFWTIMHTTAVTVVSSGVKTAGDSALGNNNSTVPGSPYLIRGGVTSGATMGMPRTPLSARNLNGQRKQAFSASPDYRAAMALSPPRPSVSQRGPVIPFNRAASLVETSGNELSVPGQPLSPKKAGSSPKKPSPHRATMPAGFIRASSLPIGNGYNGSGKGRSGDKDSKDLDSKDGGGSNASDTQVGGPSITATTQTKSPPGSPHTAPEKPPSSGSGATLGLGVGGSSGGSGNGRPSSGGPGSGSGSGGSGGAASSLSPDAPSRSLGEGGPGRRGTTGLVIGGGGHASPMLPGMLEGVRASSPRLIPTVSDVSEGVEKETDL